MIASIAAGLLFTITPDTSSAKVIGFQLLYGIGLGGALQNTIIAIQTEYAREEEFIPQASSVVNFVQIVGGVIGVTVGAGRSKSVQFIESIFTQRLLAVFSNQ